jgi:hypothetical protein
MQSLSAQSGGRLGLTSHLPGEVLLGVLTLLVIFGIVALCSRRHRRAALLSAGWIGGTIGAVYLVIRGVAEFFLIQYNDPASYHNAWGGPSLAGVFLVHSGPGFLVLAGAAGYLWRRARARRSPAPAPSQPPVALTRL